MRRSHKLSWLLVVCSGCTGTGPSSTTHHGIAEASYREVAPGLFVERHLASNELTRTSWVEVELPETDRIGPRTILVPIEQAAVPPNGQWLSFELPAAEHGDPRSVVDKRARMISTGSILELDVADATMFD